MSIHWLIGDIKVLNLSRVTFVTSYLCISIFFCSCKYMDVSSIDFNFLFFSLSWKNLAALLSPYFLPHSVLCILNIIAVIGAFLVSCVNFWLCFTTYNHFLILVKHCYQNECLKTKCDQVLLLIKLNIQRLRITSFTKYSSIISEFCCGLVHGCSTQSPKVGRDTGQVQRWRNTEL